MRSRRTVSLMALAAIGLIGCGSQEQQTVAPLRPVRTKLLEQRAEAGSALLAGVARAGIESNLSFRVSGTVVELPATVGQRVPAGRLLGRLDPVDYELGVEQARASLAQAQAGLRQAIADYGRVRALYENNNASKRDLDAGRAGFESAEAQVEAAQKRLDQAQQQVGYTILRAPIAGTVAAVEVEINETIPSGRTVVRLTSGETPEVEVGVSEVTISHIEAGTEAVVRFDALPGRSFAGTITEVGVAPSSGSSTYPVTVVLKNADASIRSGMSAEVAFSLAASPDDAGIVVPPVAVGEDSSGRFVFLLEDRGDGLGVVRRRSVTVGHLTRGGLEIVDGLSIGDTLVTAGVRRLIDGMEVRHSPDDGDPWM